MNAYTIGRNHAKNFHLQYKGATQAEYDAYRDEMAKRTFKGAASCKNYVEGFNEQVSQHGFVVSEEASPMDTMQVKNYCEGEAAKASNKGAKNIYGDVASWSAQVDMPRLVELIRQSYRANCELWADAPTRGQRSYQGAAIGAHRAIASFIGFSLKRES